VREAVHRVGELPCLAAGILMQLMAAAATPTQQAIILNQKERKS